MQGAREPVVWEHWYTVWHELKNLKMTLGGAIITVKSCWCLVLCCMGEVLFKGVYLLTGSATICIIYE